jgi:hypothetical protein
LKGIRSNSVHFALEGAPVLTRVTPDAASAGTEVRIEGSGFSTTLAQNSVRFGGVAAVVRSVTENLLVVVVPDGASSGPVIVRVGSLESNPLPFTVLPTRQPQITEVQVSNLTSSAATITWLTDLPADGRVRFGAGGTRG